jgi:predicted dehydrogenase
MQEALKLNPGAKTYARHEDLLAHPGVDFTVCAGPDHWHAIHMTDSIRAGKDCYTEKPLARTLEEGARMVKAVAASDRIVQVGMQRRSAPMCHKAKALIDQGALGRVTMVKAQWHWNVAGPLDNRPPEGKLDWDRFLGEAPRRPLEPRRWRAWRQFWDYAGGNMTDQGTHLMDVVQWYTGHGAPKSALCHGFLAKNVGAEHPDVFSAVFDYGDMMATWTLNYCNDFEDSWSILFMGDKGTLRTNDAGFTVWREPWVKNQAPIIEEKAPVPLEAHIQNFLDCLRTRQQPNCPPAIAQVSVAGPHLANIAMRKGTKVSLAADLVTVS